MKKNILTIMFLTCVMMLSSCGKKTETDSKEIAEDQNEEKFDSTSIEKDTEFAVDAADGSMLEVKLGELAQTNGTSAKVKELGQTMVTDHSQANQELKDLAGQKNISLPGTLSEKSQKKYNDIAEKTGEDFDKAFSEAMVKDHKYVIGLFQRQAENGNDADLRTWASGKLPTLQHHLSMAEQTEDAVKKAAKNN